MNCVIGLCHFCECHGPRLVYSTQPRPQDDQHHEEVLSSSSNSNSCNVCCGCSPSEASVPITSIINEGDENPRNEIVFRSQQAGPATTELLRLAAIRSLSCEVSSNTEDALVFFGDDANGYVLSYAFQIHDTRARGLKRWFSLVVLMLDKIYLLNLTPFFSGQFKGIAEKLASIAEKVYNEEQSQCSQRSLRLRNGMNTSTPRSLAELTGNKNVFVYLHTEFCRILSSATKIYSESYENTLSNFNTENIIDDENKKLFNITEIKKYLGHENFCKIVYCTLVGKQVIVRGSSKICEDILNLLHYLLPGMNSIREFEDYVPPNVCKILYCKTAMAVPQPCEGICRLDIVDELPVLHWTGKQPSKYPMYMTKILKSLDEDNLKEDILKQHILALKEEWINNCTALKNILESSKDNLVCLKKIFGITCHDESLIEYWTTLVK